MNTLRKLMGEDQEVVPVEVGESPTPMAPKAPEPVEEQVTEEAAPVEESSDDSGQKATITNQNVLNALGLTSGEVEVVKSISTAEVVVRQGEREFVVGVETLGE